MNKYEYNEQKEFVKCNQEYKVDIPVLLIFFNRPDKIEQVFQQVKKARPSKLYLYQDGARVGNLHDQQNVLKCREAVANIDWNCEVHRLYQEKNFGCDPSEYIAQKWMFSQEQEGIILEDDDVPALSFFTFCKELLEKYRNDDRIAIICGMNNYDVETSTDDSYFFSKRGSIWGWASWKRFIDLWDGEYSWIGDRKKEDLIRGYCDYALNYDQYLTTSKRHKVSGKEHYESIMFAAAAQSNMLNIVPKYNMICNIGIDKESTHSVADIRLIPKRNQKLMYKKTYEISFPLKHPQKVQQNIIYDKKYSISLIEKYWDLLELGIRRILFRYILK